MQPWWYDALLGVLVFVMLGSYSAHDTRVTLGSLVVFVVGIRVLMAVYRRRTGAWVRGDRSGPTRRAYVTWLAVAFPVFGLALFAEEVLEVRGAMVGAGVVLGVGIVVISRWWTRIYVAELRGER